jgi:hypothetical protein
MTTDEVMSWLIHADSKQGKSTLTSTVPLPAIIADAEGSWKFINQQGYKSGKPLRKRMWDPNLESPPIPDGTWDVCRVHVDSWQTMRQLYLRLHSETHEFQSFVLDSVSELQRRCKKEIKGSGPMQIQQWGELLDNMDGLIRGYRDLMYLPNTLRCMVFVAETNYKDNMWRPAVQGALKDQMPYWVDVCGYLYTDLVTDPQTGLVTAKVKKLLVGAGVNPQYLAGERVQGMLPDIIDSPNIAEMMAMVYPSMNEEQNRG